MKVKMGIDLLAALLRYVCNDFVIQKKSCRGNCFLTFMNIAEVIKTEIK